MEKEEDNILIIDETPNLEGATAAAGFAVVLIIIGLPVWWYTTIVYRANLPYSQIGDLAEKPIYHNIDINIFSSNLTNLWKQLDSNLFKNDVIKFNITSKPLAEEETKNFYEANKNNIEEKLLSIRFPIISGLSLIEYPGNLRDLGISSHIIVGRKRYIIYDSYATVKTISNLLLVMSIDPLAREKLENQYYGKILSEEKNKIQLLRQVQSEPGYDITLTLMLPQPHLLKTDWNISEAIDFYLSPMLNQLEQVADIRVRSQILYMTSLEAKPKWSDKNAHYVLPDYQLPLTINAIEAKLGSFVSTRPALHFIVYVPRMDHLPLQIYDETGNPLSSNSFLVPRWGGVLIYNPDLPVNKTHMQVPYGFNIDSHHVMQMIITQLHKLLPIPQLDFVNEEVSMIAGTSSSLTDWQIDGLSRARTLMYLHNIKITLQSLCQLVGEISNMVVSDEVAGWVAAAADDYEECLSLANTGQVENATRKCIRAFKYSDGAFFHPSMLSLLYFPDNQKYAIYIPLFLPVSIPVLLSLRMLFKMVRASRFKQKLE